MRVGIKHCGTCNPFIDVEWIARALRERLERNGFEVVPPGASGPDALILICGCPRACLDRPDVRQAASASVLVAGETVECNPTSEQDIPRAVERALSELTHVAPDTSTRSVPESQASESEVEPDGR